MLCPSNSAFESAQLVDRFAYNSPCLKPCREHHSSLSPNETEEQEHTPPCGIYSDIPRQIRIRVRSIRLFRDSLCSALHQHQQPWGSTHPAQSQPQWTHTVTSFLSLPPIRMNPAPTIPQEKRAEEAAQVPLVLNALQRQRHRPRLPLSQPNLYQHMTPHSEPEPFLSI